MTTAEPAEVRVDRPVRPAAEARWYCLDRDGVAMLCKDEADARAQVIENNDCWPGRAPHCAVLLGEVSATDAHIPMARLIELETAEHERDILRGVPTELIACLIDARDDVASELQRCREAAGYPSTDRRLAAQEALLERVDAAISAATGENNPC